MQAQTIAQLAWYKPRSKNAARLSACSDIKGLSPQNASDIIHYAECHKNLQFGWSEVADIFLLLSAETFADNNKDMTIIDMIFFIYYFLMLLK